MTSSFSEMWNNLATQAKVGIFAGVAIIVACAIALGVWAYSAEYQVLFADIATRDAASMTAELDRLKVPYQLSDGGNTILVPKDLVYKTRLKLMAKDLPLHGAVGFEVFNNADFGMTEFVQKVNYQRAIQGELTRTILSIDDIQAARVHLAIPEQGLFKKALTKPKASVTLTMKSGRSLMPDQIIGIQRLIAASVADVVSSDVTILDHHGIALTRLAQGEEAGISAVSQFDSKRTTEEYLARKVNQVLDRTFGAGGAIASIDVSLNMDQSKVTTEEVLPAKSTSESGSPTGVVVRERQTMRESNGSAALTKGSASTSELTSSESDYQVGRRTEQVVFSTGSIKRLTIAVVVKRSLSDTQIDKLKEVVSVAAGFNSQRGDSVVVYSMDKFLASGKAADESLKPTEVSDSVVGNEGIREAARSANASADDSVRENSRSKFAPVVPNALSKATTNTVIWILAGLLIALATGWIFFGGAGTRKRLEQRSLSVSERERMLLDVRKWIQGSASDENAKGVRK